VGASLSVFDGGATINAFRQARLNRTNALNNIQKAKDDKAIEVMTKFVDAVYAQRAIALSEEKLRNSKALLDKTRRLLELGEKSRPDVAQMESQVAEDDYLLLHQRNLAVKAMADLKSAMNYPQADTLALSLPSVSVDMAVALPATQAGCDSLLANASLMDKPAVRMALAEAENARLEWKIQRAALWPTLSMGAGVATNYYRNLTSGGQADGFGSQFHNNMGEYIYLSLTIPLFSPTKWNTARKAKTDWKLARLNVEDSQRKLHDDMVQALLDYRGYGREAAQLTRKAAADSLALHLSTRKYEEGMLSTFDLHTVSQTLLDTRLKLLQTQMLLALKERLVKYYLYNQPLW
jgi:outer membrane protein